MQSSMERYEIVETEHSNDFFLEANNNKKAKTNAFVSPRVNKSKLNAISVT